MAKKPKDKGKINIRGLLQSFKEGDRVQLIADPTNQKKGLFNLKFYGRMGIIKGKQGKSYKVAVKEQSKVKEILAHPVHLKRL